MSAMVAVDLDQTLIYSPGAVGRLGGTELDDLALVEHHEPSGARSYVVAELRDALDELRAKATVVPVTTRTRAQFERIEALGSAPFDPSLCANGGILLVGGEPDPSWAAEVTDALGDGGAPVTEAAAALDGLGLSERPARVADELFCYVVVDDVKAAATALGKLHEELQAVGWDAHLSGRKLYATPVALTKATAVQRLASRLRADAIVAVGDSVLDVPMLVEADFAIAPAHADAEARDVADHVTASAGPASATEALAAATRWIDARRPGAGAGAG